jgi:hypothetical protein
LVPLEKKAGKMAVRFVNIELTNLCNLKCSYCALVNSRREKGMMSRETFQRVLDLCCEQQQYLMTLSHFGESLLHPELEHFVRAASNRGRLPGFCSNGLLLSVDKLKMLADAGLCWIAVTLHDDLKQMRRLSLAGAHQLDELRQNAESLRQTAADIGIYLELREFSDHRSFVSSGGRLIRKHDFAGQAPDKGQPRPLVRCTFRQGTHCVVLWDGRIGSCCYDERGNEYLGDIFHPESIRLRDSYALCSACAGMQIPDVYGPALAPLAALERAPRFERICSLMRGDPASIEERVGAL